MNLLDAAYNTVHDYAGGAQSLAPRMGKSACSLSHEVTATGTAKLGLLDAAKVVALTGDLRILQAFAANAGQMLVPLPHLDVELDDSMLRLAAAACEFGEMCTAVASTLSDGVITDNELVRIDRECGELIASVHHLRESLAARNIAAKPAYLKAAA